MGDGAVDPRDHDDMVLLLDPQHAALVDDDRARRRRRMKRQLSLLAPALDVGHAANRAPTRTLGGPGEKGGQVRSAPPASQRSVISRGYAAYVRRSGITPQYDLSACLEQPNLEKIGWYCWNANKATHPPGQKDTNPWGLVDIAGNVSEWVHDHYDGLGYGSGRLTDPGTGYQVRGSRVVRGGDVAGPAILARAAFRFEKVPGSRDLAIGFRLARTVRYRAQLTTPRKGLAVDLVRADAELGGATVSRISGVETKCGPS